MLSNEGLCFDGEKSQTIAAPSAERTMNLVKARGTRPRIKPMALNRRNDWLLDEQAGAFDVFTMRLEKPWFGSVLRNNGLKSSKSEYGIISGINRR